MHRASAKKKKGIVEQPDGHRQDGDAFIIGHTKLFSS
jgi:hypothetical protein